MNSSDKSSGVGSRAFLGFGLLVLVVGISMLSYLWWKHRAYNNAQIPIVLAENPIPLSAMTLLATQGNYFGKHGLRVKAVQFPSGRAALDAVLGGGAQFATVAETPLVLAALAQQKLAVVATIADSKEEMQLVVRSDRIHTLEDLRGATLATTRGTNSEYFMNAFLQRIGIDSKDPKQVKIVSMKPSEMVNAFSNGSLSGYFTWQPFVHEGMKLKALQPVSYSGRDCYTMTFNIVTSAAFASQHPDQVRDFLSSLKDAQDAIGREPGLGKQAVVARTGIDASTLDSLWPTYNFGLRLNDSLLSAMETQRSWAMESGGYPTTDHPDFSDLLYPDALRSIDPSLVTLTNTTPAR